MDELKAIAWYLIDKRITSSQSMAKWFIPIIQEFHKDFEAKLQSGEFHMFIRKMYDEKVINSRIATLLLQVSLWLHEAREYIRQIKENGVQVVLWGDDEYPFEFNEIPDKPTVLFCSGNSRLLKQCNKITLVGSRTCSPWGIMKAKQLSYEATKLGVITVSGLAQGIDSFVFEETIKRGGQTIAVLPQLQVDMESISDSCLYISEYPQSVTPISKWQFVARNRLLAALSPITVVIEAPLRSGTLITSDLALSYDRSVYVVLPDPQVDESQGGIAFALKNLQGTFIQSLYDVYLAEQRDDFIESYKIFIDQISQHLITIRKSDARNLGDADLKRYIYNSSSNDLSLFERNVVELHRFGIIKERKNKIVFNFSGYNSWPKT